MCVCVCVCPSPKRHCRVHFRTIIAHQVYFTAHFAEDFDVLPLYSFIKLKENVVLIPSSCNNTAMELHIWFRSAEEQER